MIAVLDGISLLLLVDALTVEPHPVQVVTVLAMLAASALAIRFCWFMRVGLGGGLPHPAWTSALLLTAAAAWVLGLWAPGATLIAAVPLVVAGTLVAALLPTPVRIGFTVIVLAAAAAHAMLGAQLGTPAPFDPGGPVWLVALYCASLPIMVFSSVWWWEIVVTLDRHRRAAGELAVAEERLRFAADLHDIQGHHLQVIALKAELAERLLERDPAAAREQLRETRLIAKQALEETRSLVAGYRGVDLDAELENARDVLELSGAECTLAVDGLPADAEVRRVLALAVREATTNILRHSSATRAAIRISTGVDGVALTIVNDGPHERTAGDSTSSGLAGLRERVAAIGGTLDDALLDGEFRLEVRVPSAVEVHA
jgi:two-component system sensor histidine kinase DesK